ncbi:MAG: hypothetical protein JWR26_22 [Pedosphaera sp.]|nr:hypothetical protein [Pedosphaera sp.]
MKQSFWRISCCAGLLCAASLIASAGQIKRADVAADPNWVLHLDIDSLRTSTIGQFILSEMDKPEAKAKLAAMQTIFNFDLRSQLHGMTLYGASQKPEEGVLMIYADFDANRLLTLAKAGQDYQGSDHNGHTIHSWIDDKKKAKGDANPRIYAAIQGPRVVLGQSEDRIAQALDVLDKKSANLASTKSFPQMGASAPGNFVQAAARKMDIAGSDPNAAIMKLSQMLQFDLGESKEKLQATLSVVAESDEVAGQIASIGQGLMSLLKLQQDKPEAVKLANALSLKQDGTRVVASLTLPSSDVLEIIQADIAKKAAAVKSAR